MRSGAPPCAQPVASWPTPRPSSSPTILARGAQLAPRHTHRARADVDLYGQGDERAGQAITGDTSCGAPGTPRCQRRIGRPNAGLVTALAQGTTRIRGAWGRWPTRRPSSFAIRHSSTWTQHAGHLALRHPQAPYAHIQDGVNAADPGDTVFVRTGSGPYSESVVLNHDVTVEGDPTPIGRRATIHQAAAALAYTGNRGHHGYHDGADRDPHARDPPHRSTARRSTGRGPRS